MKIASKIRFYVYINDHETRNSSRDGKMVGKSFNYLSFLLFVGFYTQTHSTSSGLPLYHLSIIKNIKRLSAHAQT